MAKALVVGHGAYDTGKFTFVPRGWTVHFHADADTYLVQTNGLATVADGTIAPRQTYSGGDRIPNYGMTLLEDEGLAAYLATRSTRTSGVLFFVGAELSGSGVDSIPVRSSGEMKLCTSRSRCQLLGKHGPTCRGLFRFMARRRISEIHLLCCRADSRAENAPRTIALGDEPVHGIDADVGVVPGMTHAKADDRHYPGMVRGQRALEAEFGRDRQAQVARLEQLPQAVVAAMPGALPAWADIQLVRWPARRVDAPTWFPDVLLTSTDASPGDLPSAWQDDRWRNAFWLYCHGPGAADGHVVARLLLYSMLRTHTGPPVVLLDDTGKAHPTERVLDSEILHFCQGSHGRDPGVDSSLVKELETEIATSSRLYVAAHRSPAVLKSIDVDWIGDLGPAEAYTLSLQRVRRVLAGIENHVLSELDGVYQEFRAFHARWWQVRWGDAIFGPGDEFRAAWAVVSTLFAAHRATLDAVVSGPPHANSIAFRDDVRHFIELFDAMSGSVEEAQRWRLHLDIVDPALPPFADRVRAVQLLLEAAAFNAQLMENMIHNSRFPQELTALLEQLVADMRAFVTTHIEAALPEITAALNCHN
ncbi:putative adhesin [Lentzea sp. NPDC051208]|uniref:putative adhesin n=1 Tax=Lentzea sp. NPDC051208 TaxID=3154642 RepID=UPI003412A20F